MDVPPQAGFGPGAGVGGKPGGGNASHRTTPDASDSTGWGPTYGDSILIPVVAGSGGSGSNRGGGGSGGGGILIASNVKITIPAGGAINAHGGRGPGGSDGAGSAGSIRLVAPVVEGAGILGTQGGLFYAGNEVTVRGAAGNGRIRIDTLDSSGIGFQYNFNNGPSIGSSMIARVVPFPRLDITEAAGNAIALGSGPVTIIRPLGSSPDITVKLQAKDFGGQVPTQLYVTPDSGTRAVYAATIDNTATNPATTTINITVPTNVRVTLTAFAGGSLPPAP
jgi:hypothetical protein